MRVLESAPPARCGHGLRGDGCSAGRLFLQPEKGRGLCLGQVRGPGLRISADRRREPEGRGCLRVARESERWRSRRKQRGFGAAGVRVRLGHQGPVIPQIVERTPTARRDQACVYVCYVCAGLGQTSGKIHPGVHPVSAAATLVRVVALSGPSTQRPRRTRCISAPPPKA